jgi:uncharacterized cupin superfamily protein
MARHARNHCLSALRTVALAGLLSACGGELPPGSTLEMGSAALNGAEANATAGANAMIVYSPRGKPVDEAGFFSLGSPEDLGGRVLEGDPKIFARMDYVKGPAAAGLFKATTGKIEVTFPFTEHATILEGEVTITDGTGQRHVYKAGDSYFIRQGSVVIWEVKGKQVIKSFFNTVETP